MTWKLLDHERLATWSCRCFQGWRNEERRAAPRSHCLCLTDITQIRGLLYNVFRLRLHFEELAVLTSNAPIMPKLPDRQVYAFQLPNFVKSLTSNLNTTSADGQVFDTFVWLHAFAQTTALSCVHDQTLDPNATS